MPGGLWDYDEPSPSGADLQHDVAVPSGSPIVPIEEDDDGNGRPGRKRRGRPAKKSKLGTPSLMVLEETMLTLVDSDSDSDFKVTSIVPGKALRQDEDEDELLGVSKSSAAMQPPVPPCKRSAATHGASAGSLLSDATRMAMEKSKALNQQLVAQLASMDDDDEFSLSPAPLAPRGSLRMHSHDHSSFRQTLQEKPTEYASTKTAEDEALLREDAAATAAAGISGVVEEIDDGSKITIVLQCKKGEISIRTRKADSFVKLQKSFLTIAESKGWLIKGSDTPPAGFKMLFDGEKIDLEATPEELDLEDGEKIDVSWKA